MNISSYEIGNDAINDVDVPITSAAAIYGDGIHDDTLGIQSLLDSRVPHIYLGSPEVNFLISRPLKINSGQCIELDPYAVIRLAPGSDCVMITNSDHLEGNRNISVIGGIWDMDNRNQTANPLALPSGALVQHGPFDPERYLGICMRFIGVEHLTIKHLVFRDPVTFCTQFARIQYFTIEDITFDFQHWNPHPVNMDGIHLDGGCRHGVIRNLRGRTFDDMVALNADDIEGETPHAGPIEDIDIEGLYAEDCHSAVRLLSTGSPVRRISISNIHGSYYQYAIAFTHFFSERKSDGLFEEITIRNFFCRKAPRIPMYMKDMCPDFPLIWLEKRTHVHELRIDGVGFSPQPGVVVLGVDEGASVEGLDIPEQLSSVYPGVS